MILIFIAFFFCFDKIILISLGHAQDTPVLGGIQVFSLYIKPIVINETVVDS